MVKIHKTNIALQTRRSVAIKLISVSFKKKNVNSVESLNDFVNYQFYPYVIHT